MKRLLLLVPFYRESLSTYFSPYLGQYNINPTVFLKELNDLLPEMDEDEFYYLTIPVYIYLMKQNKYIIVVKYPYVRFLYRYCNKRRKSLLTLYKISNLLRVCYKKVRHAFK